MAFGLVLGVTPIQASAAHVRHHRGVQHRDEARHRLGAAQAPYSSAYDPRPTCRFPDGTPFDPDIIGGPNHVGDGGPAANLGGFGPCGY